MGEVRSMQEECTQFRLKDLGELRVDGG